MAEELCTIHNIKKYHPECSGCRGEGDIESDDDMFTFRPRYERCYSCGGSGVAAYLSCELCEEEAMYDDACEKEGGKRG